MEYKGASRGRDNTIQANNLDWTTMQLNQALLIGPHFNIATRGCGVSSSQNNVTENSAATRFSSVRRGSFAEELVEKCTGKEKREREEVFQRSDLWKSGDFRFLEMEKLEDRMKCGLWNRREVCE
ncbi:hypothetical protein LSTR_LSTR005658 [Laodelphax striatellus]|uniref:Uncharacterized protein n=1 Tax=Laodelphax striatellus TaxID=195883 RepID=A0A482X8S9_LAOST|nr:hypothetical protein LSTR_LSTR005658 [Laodelphax striatellus]